MGAQQAFHWGALFPDRVERDRADLRFGQDLGSQFRFSRRRQGGADRPSGLAGRRVRHPADARLPGDRRSIARRIWRKIGFSSLEDFLIDSWEANFRRRDANDLLAMLWTWQPHADNSANELAAATSIKHWVQSPPTRP